MNSLKSHRKLIFYDAVILLGITWLFLLFESGNVNIDTYSLLFHGALIFIIVFVFRFAFKVYDQIWRFSGPYAYILLILSDCVASIVCTIICRFMPINHVVTFKIISITAVSCLLTIFIRYIYQFLYKTEFKNQKIAKFGNFLLNVFANGRIQVQVANGKIKKKIAIIGAGKLGINLCTELLENSDSGYEPVMFIDKDIAKQGKTVNGIKVYTPGEETMKLISVFKVEEIVFTITHIDKENKAKLFKTYKPTKCKLKIYDYPIFYASEKKQIREIDIEDLLPRNAVKFNNAVLGPYFENKTVLITGGGGSIGSEMARQIAYFNPSNLILLDIYENGIYDVKQDINIVLGYNINISLEVVSVTDFAAIDDIFNTYKPNIVIHAAAHKHVPLMEHNCIEAIKNNIFGTKNVIDCCEKYKVDKFMMVSTDKAVNPTNVMGATKRFCEMMAQSMSINGKVSYSSTRFGNVLGSAGSVVPLFKKQIANGGPITITDKRIIRYFMTIPEACNLVLNATVMANNGDLFVLDMGRPVRIVDLAKNMITFSGANDIEIIETGLRPGEKLFEEILTDTKHFSKTQNDLIYIEKDKKPISNKDIIRHCKNLQVACETMDNKIAYKALRDAVPTFIDAASINYKVVEMG